MEARTAFVEIAQLLGEKEDSPSGTTAAVVTGDPYAATRAFYYGSLGGLPLTTKVLL